MCLMRGQTPTMKGFIVVACLICFAQTQNLPNGDSTRYSDDRERKFRLDCPAQCTCSKTPCGLEMDCSDRTLSEVPFGLSPLTECLDLSLNNITEIHPESFEELHQLKKLCLSGNFISELPVNVFAGSRKLEQLFMQDNRLQAVPANTLSKMPNLKDLNLGANYISSISSNAFVKLDSLEHLWLDDNSLTSIPSRALGKAPSIKALALDLNEITRIRNGDLDELHMLRVLLLKHNSINSIDNNAFSRATSIQIIDLSYNNLTSLPPAVKGALNLQQLTLSYNRITTLPDLAFAGNPDLEKISLVGNPIKNVGKTTFTGLKDLRGLYLENAEDIKEFPDFSGCTHLEDLEISGGQLTSIPDGLCSSLPNLQRLYLQGNRLKNISGLLRCNNLTHLDVSNNQLTKVTFAETKNMTKMVDLKLDNNEIRHLDDDVFSKMYHIDNLNLAYNYFTFLPMKGGVRGVGVLNISGVSTMLYLPPVDLFQNLRSLTAYYPYHCCQVAKIPRKPDDNSVYRHPVFSTVDDDAFPPMTSPVQCSPGPGPMTPCDDLLPSTPIRIFWWFAVVASFLFNGIILLSCALRYCAKRRSRRPTAVPSDEEILRRADSESPYPDARMVVHDSNMSTSHYCLNFSRGRSIGNESDTFDISLCHLALADFIVSLYTAIILSYDQSTRGEFAEKGAWWQQSELCHSAGFLLTFGTQLAFCTVFVMTIERYLATMHPLQTEKHMRKTILVLILTSFWVISLATATVTLFGGTGNDDADGILNMLPAKSGATCLPWTTDFAYVAGLVGTHVILCFTMVILCALMFCARRKQSWLSARKSTRRQVTMAVAVNVLFILPLALLALCVSGFMTYSDLIAGHSGEYSAPEDGRTVLDMGRLLSFAMFVIPFRPLLNPILYLSFNRALRRDLAYLGKKVLFGNSSSRRPAFPQRHNSVMESVFDSVGDVPQDQATGYPLFNRPVFSNDFMRQTVAYDNRGIVSSSSVSYNAPSVTLGPSSSRHGGSQRTSTSSERRKRRYTRSQRGERRTTDTDPTTESEIITFHRSGEVSYNPEVKERRRKKLSVRNGGVNAKDEFQRLVFPRVPKAPSTDHGSDFTVYPIMPAPMSAVTGSSCIRHNIEGSSKNLSCDADASDVSSADCVSTNFRRRPEHYDISALNAYYGQNPSVSTAPQYSKSQEETSSEPTDTSYDADLEVAEINADMSPISHDENPFFDDRDTAKRLYSDISRKKINYSLHEDCPPSTSRDSNDNFEQIKHIYHAVPVPIRKERLTSQSSSCVSGDVHPISRMSKIGNSCEYCDSSASKDSGIHSEIDSTSGASYSDTSIGRRLHFSTSGGGLKSVDMTKGGGDRNNAPLYNINSFDFEIVSNIDDTNQVKINPIVDPETTI